MSAHKKRTKHCLICKLFWAEWERTISRFAYRTSFLDMMAGAIRSDCEFSTNYVDKFFIDVKKYVDHTLLDTPTRLGLFVVQMCEGKTNQVMTFFLGFLMSICV